MQWYKSRCNSKINFFLGNPYKWAFILDLLGLFKKTFPKGWNNTLASTGRAMSQQDQRHLFRVDCLHIFNSIVNILSISFSYIINIIIIYYQYIQRLTVFIAFISIFAVVKLFPLSLELLKPPATYAIFAFIRFVFYFKFQPYIPFHLLNRHPPTRNLRSQNSFFLSP